MPRITYRSALFLMFCTLLASVTGAQEEARSSQDEFRILDIQFEGNRRTKERTMLQEMRIRPGDVADAESIEKDRQQIMDLGLFKSVVSRLQEAEDGKILIITVEEKFYWLAWPRLSRSGDGDISYGIGARVDNLFGLNQQMELVLRRKELEDTDVQEEEEIRVRYKYPRIAGSAWNLRLQLSLQSAFIDEERNGVTGTYDQQRNGISVIASRWRDPLGPSAGWELAGGFFFDRYDNEHLAGSPDLYFDADVAGLHAALRFRQIQDFAFSNSGKHFGYSVDVARDELGSDVSFVKQHFFYRDYNLVGKREHTNLNYQLTSGHINQTVFGDYEFNIANSYTVRGYQRDTIEGDFFVTGNLEYLRPINKKNSLRMAMFADTGNAWDSFSDLDLGDLKYAVGVGLRWRVQALVKTDLRLDIAQGLSEFGETKVYASTRGTF